ncbi:hypothetical protein ACF0H5_004167 [Mactra antiquata]
MSTLVLFYVIPLSIMIVLYVKIIRRLRHSASENNVATEGLHLRQAKDILVGRRRSARMLVFVVMMFGFCYLYYNIVVVIDFFDGVPRDFDTMVGILWPMSCEFCCRFDVNQQSGTKIHGENSGIEMSNVEQKHCVDTLHKQTEKTEQMFTSKPSSCATKCTKNIILSYTCRPREDIPVMLVQLKYCQEFQIRKVYKNNTLEFMISYGTP